MHEQARVVIIGSGIAGSSIAYHLAERGWRDIVVLEQGPLIGGTTSHAPGLVGQLRSSISLTKMLVYSVELYKTLQVDGTPPNCQSARSSPSASASKLSLKQTETASTL